MSKKCKCVPQKKGLDGWVMTYGDMMSLLLTFFVLIVSFSSMQEAKFEDAALSLRDAFGVMNEPDSVIEFKDRVVPVVSQVQADILYEVRELEQSLLDIGLDKEVDITVTEKGIAFRIDAPFLFDSGRANLKQGNSAVLDSLAGFIDGVDYPVRIEGHTDSVPISTARFPSNWELSAARAVTVARFFQAAGVAPGRIAAMGFGEYHPLESNATSGGRAKNRRVEIYLKLDEQPELQERLPLQTEETNDGR